MASNCRGGDELSEKQVTERMNQALKRALKTPVKPKWATKPESTKKGGGGGGA